MNIGSCRIQGQTKLAFDQVDEFDLVYLFDELKSLDLADAALKHHTIRHSSTRQTYTWNALSELSKLENEHIEIQKFKGEPNDALYELALLSGTHSRFKLDPGFSREQFEQFYKTWLANSLNGEMADEVFVAKHEGAIVGLVTFKINTTTQQGSIGLIAVDTNHQNLGIGKSLISAIKKYTQAQKISGFTVATQLENENACTFYERNGLHLLQSVNVYHLWKI